MTTATKLEPEIMTTTVNHAEIVAKNMREIDKKEVMIANGFEPFQAIIESYRLSKWAFTIRVEEEIVCIWGVVPGRTSDLIGAPWMLSTDAIEKCPRLVLMFGKKFLEQMLTRFTHLSNYVLAENTSAIHWLEWLHFTVDPPAPYGVKGADFRHFHMRGPGICVPSQQQL